MAFAPMHPSPTVDVPQGDEWMYEPKWDGMRGLVSVSPECQVRLVSRNGVRWTDAFPELADLGRTLGRQVVLDGELIVMGDDGRPDFGALSQRLRARRPGWARRRWAATYVAFDVLDLDGDDLTSLPWWQRRELLVGLGLEGPAVATMVCDDGTALFAATRSLGVEGVVAKRRGSRYACGRRTRAWCKVKHKGSGWFDVAGYRLPGKAWPAGGILLTDDGRPAGVALSCLPSGESAVLHGFIGRHGTREGDTVRVPPAAQVRVEYLERSPRGLLREAVARDLRAVLPP